MVTAHCFSLFVDDKLIFAAVDTKVGNIVVADDVEKLDAAIRNILPNVETTQLKHEIPPALPLHYLCPPAGKDTVESSTCPTPAYDTTPSTGATTPARNNSSCSSNSSSNFICTGDDNENGIFNNMLVLLWLYQMCMLWLCYFFLSINKQGLGQGVEYTRSRQKVRSTCLTVHQTVLSIAQIFHTVF